MDRQIVTLLGPISVPDSRRRAAARCPDAVGAGPYVYCGAQSHGARVASSATPEPTPRGQRRSRPTMARPEPLRGSAGQAPPVAVTAGGAAVVARRKPYVPAEDR